MRCKECNSLLGTIIEKNHCTNKQCNCQDTKFIEFIPGNDSFDINNHTIFEVCNGEYAVYSQECIEEMEKHEPGSNFHCDYPIFKSIMNAISYCLGHINKHILRDEEDLKMFLEREENERKRKECV